MMRKNMLTSIYQTPQFWVTPNSNTIQRRRGEKRQASTRLTVTMKINQSFSDKYEIEKPFAGA